jgi:hypothetical protein
MAALPSAVTALARTRSPNSTTATKLFPLVPYHFFVSGYPSDGTAFAEVQSQAVVTVLAIEERHGEF